MSLSNAQVLSQEAAPFNLTAAEIAASVTPTNFGYPPGDIRRYGAVVTVNCDAIITTAASCNSTVIIPNGAWVITAQPAIPNNNVSIQVMPGATFSGAGATALGFHTNPTGFNGLHLERMKINGISVSAGDGISSPQHYYVSNDTADTTTSSNGNMRLMTLNHGVSAGHTGGRSALYALLQIVGAPGISPAGWPGYVAVEALTQISVNCGGVISGSITTYLGTVYGANPWARSISGATALFGVVSQEIDVSVGIGSSCGKKHALTLNKTTGDFYRGDFDDSALSISDQGGLAPGSGAMAATAIISGRAYLIKTVGTTDYTLIGSPNNTVNQIFVATGVGAGTGTVVNEIPAWRQGISFGSYASQWPLDANSSMIYAWQRVEGIPGANNVVSIEANRAYKIAVTGTTTGPQWTALGDLSAAPGTVNNTFIALINGTTAMGTGTVTRGIDTAAYGIDFRNVLFKTSAFASTGFSVSPTGIVQSPLVRITGKVVVNNNAGNYTVASGITYVGFTGTQAASVLFTFPAGAAAIDGTTITIFTVAAVGTASTWASAGATFVSAPATLAAGSITAFIYDHNSTQWLRT